MTLKIRQAAFGIRLHKSERLGKFVYVTYAAVRDDKGDFQGVLEYVQDIKPFFELESDLKRDID